MVNLLIDKKMADQQHKQTFTPFLSKDKTTPAESQTKHQKKRSIVV
jgi:hypothetical protein